MEQFWFSKCEKMEAEIEKLTGRVSLLEEELKDACEVSPLQRPEESETPEDSGMGIKEVYAQHLRLDAAALAEPKKETIYEQWFRIVNHGAEHSFASTANTGGINSGDHGGITRIDMPVPGGHVKLGGLVASGMFIDECPDYSFRRHYNDGCVPCEAKTCECGAAKTGVASFKMGHSSWCPVHENKG